MRLNTEAIREYRSILKITSLFGGVQVLTLGASVIRNKVAAVLLGPTGMGVVALFNSTINLISQSSNLGIGISGVRSVSEAFGKNNPVELSRSIEIVRLWSLITGVVGWVICLLLAPWLSSIAFDSDAYSAGFRWLSIMLPCIAITGGEMVILKGVRRLKQVATCSLLSAVITLICAVPIYYLYGVSGIVPSLLIAAILIMLLHIYYGAQVRTYGRFSQIRQTLGQGCSMIKLGVALVFVGLLGSLTEYIVRIYLGNIGDVAIVGLYSSGYAIVETYMGVVLTAMTTDYYPRLSAVHQEHDKVAGMVNKQIVVGLIIMTPCLIALYLLAPWVITLLYAESFAPIVGMVQWAIPGMFCKLLSWPTAYVILAKGDTKMFFWTELLSYIILVGSMIGGYHYLGIDGLGVGYSIYQLLYMIIIVIIGNRYYHLWQSRYRQHIK